MGHKASKIVPAAATRLFLDMPDTSYWRDQPYQQAARGVRLHYPDFIVGAVSTADFPLFRINDILDPANQRLLVLYDSATGRTTQVIRA
jgi:hypothetical protein